MATKPRKGGGELFSPLRQFHLGRTDRNGIRAQNCGAHECCCNEADLFHAHQSKGGLSLSQDQADAAVGKPLAVRIVSGGGRFCPPRGLDLARAERRDRATRCRSRARETARAATTNPVASARRPTGTAGRRWRDRRAHPARAAGTPRAAAACRSIARTLAEAHSYERSFAINPEVASGGRRSERLCHEYASDRQDFGDQAEHHGCVGLDRPGAKW